MSLLPYIDRAAIAERLPRIFPEGTPNRNHCIRELSASTIFAMVYIGAVEGDDVHLGPKHVYAMTDEQAALTGSGERRAYAKQVNKPGYRPAGNRWYADNTREPIRDETLREGLVALGAVAAREDLPTTSSKPRYALTKPFAALFDPSLSGDALDEAITRWQNAHLSPSALARVRLMLSGAVGSNTSVVVTFPNRETRSMAPGPSSVISKAVIEVFAPRYLERPVVLWLSESGNKVVTRDDTLAAQIGLRIAADRNLPDIILVDLVDPLRVVFIEVVATDGPINARRKDALRELTDEAGYKRDQVSFVTAYQDRDAAGFKRTVSTLAWGSYAWFMSEPDGLIALRSGERGLS